MNLVCLCVYIIYSNTNFIFSCLFFWYIHVHAVVVRVIKVDLSDSRVLNVYLPSGQREQLSLSNSSLSVTSSNNLVAYRPRYRDLHSSNLAALFFNLDGIFPCIASVTYLPTCGILTREEDGFFQGRSFLQAGDIGNNFRIFHTTEYIKTFAFAVEGCAELNNNCFRIQAAVSIFCLLPRQHCG